jgi:peptidoglycan/LPS O-acetylase OafA/YrhL
MSDVVKRYEYLDFLRGLAVLLVLITHLHSFLDYPLVNLLGGLGARGVQLFYIVSGYTIYIIYQNNIRTKNDATGFLIKRFFRIAPLYFILLPVYFFTFYTIENGFSLTGWLNLVTHYLFVNGFFPEYLNSIMHVEWSIFVECIFYLIFAILSIFKRLANIKMLLLFFGACSLISYIIGYFFYSDTQEIRFYIYLTPYFQMYNFILGMYLAKMILENNLPKFMTKKRTLSLSILIFLLMPFYIGSTTMSTYLSSLLFLVLLSYLAAQELKFPKLFLKIGTLSYSIYLVHFLFVLLVKYLEISGVLAICIVLISTLLTSMVTYKVIEIPGINFGKFIFNKYSKIKISV